MPEERLVGVAAPPGPYLARLQQDVGGPEAGPAVWAWPAEVGVRNQAALGVRLKAEQARDFARP
jgi:hypothetical protein